MLGEAIVKEILGDLSGFPRPRLALQNQNLIISHSLHNLVVIIPNWEISTLLLQSQARFSLELAALAGLQAPIFLLHIRQGIKSLLRPGNR